MALRQMLEHDPIRDYNFPKDAFVRIVCPVGPVHDKTPMPAGPQFEGVKGVRKSVRTPPLGKIRWFCKGSEDAFSRSVYQPRMNELAVSRRLSIRNFLVAHLI